MTDALFATNEAGTAASRRIRRMAFLSFLVVSLPATSLAGTTEEKRVREISVTGNAEVRVAPDEAVLALGVQTLDAELTTARDKHNTTVRAVNKALAELQVKPEQIQTDHVGVEPTCKNYERICEPVGYVFRQTIVVTINDVTRVEEILTAAIEHGANVVHGIDFRTTRLREHRDKARALAIKAAREKAEALARELGEKIGAPTSISEGYQGWSYWGGSYWWGRYQSSWGMTQNYSIQSGPAPESGDSTVSIGLIGVSANVSVTFALRD